MFNPLIRSGFQKKEDLLNIKIFNPDGSETTITEIFRRIDSDLSGKVDKSQGTAHSGMVLYVNDNGYVDRRKFLEITPAEREKLANLPTYGLEQLSDTPDTAILCSYQLYKVENGRKTYIGDKVNIPRDLFLEDVSVLDVSDEHPLPGYENGRYFKFVFRLADGSTKTTILPVSNLSPYMDNGHHTKIEDSHVNVYDLVPQYSNINDVLDHEKVIQYIGETTEKFTHGYFYERQLISKPVTETFVFDEYNWVIDVLVDGYAVPKGRYYMIKNSPLIADLKERYKNIYFIRTDYSKNFKDKYNCNAWPILKVGDNVWTSEKTIVQVTSIYEYYDDDGILNKRFTFSDGGEVSKDIFSTGGGSSKSIDAYISVDGVILYACSAMSDMVSADLREFNGDLYAYCDGLSIIPNTTNTNYLYKSETHTITYSIGGQLDYDWQRIDVQPQGSDLTERVVANESNIRKLYETKQELISEGTTEYWNVDNKTYIPKDGEVVIYTDYDVTEDGKPVPNFKVGDGHAYVADLPFAGCDFKLKNHIADKSVHHTIEVSESAECIIIS